jgi:hypothetical protein
MKRTEEDVGWQILPRRRRKQGWDNIKAHAIRDEQMCSSRYCKGEYGMDT